MEPKKEGKGIIGKALFFTHEAYDINYGEKQGQNVIVVRNSRCKYADIFLQPQLYSEALLEDLRSAIEDPYLIQMEYNELHAQVMQEFTAELERKGKIICPSFSFFLSDEETEKGYLDRKFELLESMMSFPYIQRIEIPASMRITNQYVRHIVYEYIAENADRYGFEP